MHEIRVRGFGHLEPLVAGGGEFFPFDIDAPERCVLARLLLVQFEGGFARREHDVLGEGVQLHALPEQPL